MRLSANQVTKLNTELKITCNENEELRKRLEHHGEVTKKAAQYESKIALLSQ